jgi:hypothetical protein
MLRCLESTMRLDELFFCIRYLRPKGGQEAAIFWSASLLTIIQLDEGKDMMK